MKKKKNDLINVALLDNEQSGQGYFYSVRNLKKYLITGSWTVNLRIS